MVKDRLEEIEEMLKLFCREGLSRFDFAGKI